MSEPREAAEAYEPEVPGTAEQFAEAAPAKAVRPRRVRRWVRGRSARWVAVGAAVVVLGGGAAAVAVHHHGGEHHGEGHRVAAGEQGRGGHGGQDRQDGQDSGHDGGRHGHHGQGGQDRQDGTGPARGRAGDGTGGDAPAPLPSTDASAAVTKAAAAVAGGKVESLAPVSEQGGGRAWRAVVLGPDGVRHAVTVDGDTVTGNTVLGG